MAQSTSYYALYTWTSVIAFTVIALLEWLRTYLQEKLQKTFDVEAFAVNLLVHPLKFKNSFEKYLPVSEYIVPNTITCKNQTLSFDYEIPKCLVNSKHIEIGSILAVADLVTSVAILIHDKSHRAGVSISLSGQFHALQYSNQEAMLKQLEAGSIVHIDAHASKVGNNVGFSNFTMSTMDGQTLATVSHVKYISSGFIWERLGFLIPSVFNLALKYFPSHFEMGKRESLEHTAYSVLNLEKLSIASYSIETLKSTLNLFNAFHGGAIACTFQQASEQYIQDSTNEATKKLARYMNIEYLSPAKGHLAIEVDNHVIDELSDNGLNGGKSVKIIMRENRSGEKKLGKILSQARVIF